MSYTGTKINSAKNELMAMEGFLPKEVREGLENGYLKVVDAHFYSAKVLDSSSKELMSAADNKLEGITNLNNRKMEATNYFLLKEVRLQSATVSATTNAALAGAAYSTPADFIANGELEILVAGKTAFPRNSCQSFKRGTNEPTGLYTLDCPRLIAPQAEIVPTLRVADSARPSDTTTAVRIDLIGAMIIPA